MKLTKALLIVIVVNFAASCGYDIEGVESSAQPMEATVEMVQQKLIVQNTEMPPCQDPVGQPRATSYSGVVQALDAAGNCWELQCENFVPDGYPASFFPNFTNLTFNGANINDRIETFYWKGRINLKFYEHTNYRGYDYQFYYQPNAPDTVQQGASLPFFSSATVVCRYGQYWNN